MNVNAVFLDVARITIGADVQIGPNVQLLTPTHPVEPGPRRDKWEAARPITIGDNVWLGGGVIVLAGVTVGADTVVGAGAVVTRDLPPNVVAVGNPVFPAYFGPERLRVLASALSWPDGYVAWTNFWRDTDPLGWQVSAGERDVPVTDPEALHPSGGEVADPPIRNHSGYPEAVEFQRERALVARLLRRTVPSPRQRVG